MSDRLPAKPEFEMVITPQFENASQAVKNLELARLFIGLTRAITDHNCHVDISDPMAIRVVKTCR